MKILVDMWVRTELLVEADSGMEAYKKANAYLCDSYNYVPREEVVVDRALGHGAIRVYDTATNESLYVLHTDNEGKVHVNLLGEK